MHEKTKVQRDLFSTRHRVADPGSLGTVRSMFYVTLSLLVCVSDSPCLKFISLNLHRYMACPCIQEGLIVYSEKFFLVLQNTKPPAIVIPILFSQWVRETCLFGKFERRNGVLDNQVFLFSFFEGFAFLKLAFIPVSNP